MRKTCAALLSITGWALLTAPAAARPWQSLFDGTSLDAFEVHIKGGLPARPCFTVADGVIRTYPGWAEGQDAPNGMILTKRSFGDYHLRWEYRYDGRKFRERRNSGVLYHVQNTEVWPVCMEFQLMEGSAGWPVFMYSQAKIKLKDGVYDARGEAEEVGTLGKILLRQGATTADKPVGQWNVGELLVHGGQAYHVVNGQVIARLEALKQPNAAGTGWVGMNAGRIGFQCEGAGIEFRKIEIMEHPVGYIDTPLIPGQPWRVHDSARPQPPKIALPPYNPAPSPVPAGAVVLLGPDTCEFTNHDWRLENGVLTVARRGKQRPPQQSTLAFGDGHYHIEWREPADIQGSSQGRGNSGIFIMSTYEMQVLDCWENETYPDGMVGAIYGQMPPLFNAVRPAGQWNVYDVFFRAPVFDGDRLVKPAVVTVMLNGVIVQNNQPLNGPTAHRSVQPYRAHPAKLPLTLQDHGNPVSFRNIWVLPLDRDVTQR